MKKLFRIAFVGALIAAAFSVAPSAQAQTILGSVTFTGSAHVSTGLSYPVLGAEETRNFTFASDTCVDADVTDDPDASVGTNCSISASGTVTGYCGLSTGQGSGTYVSSNRGTYTYSFEWTSVGGELIITGSISDADGNSGPLAGIVTAIPPLPAPVGSGQSCTTGNAQDFTIVGEVAATTLS